MVNWQWPANRTAKVNEPQVRVIKRRLLNGESRYALAVEYGVTYACIRHMANGDTWRGVAPAAALDSEDVA